ncbi:hypothetical protein [Kineococcus sp. SYSU DK005]|uniref:hypothetical protein n=1 Tax=Kineococcus sp. SYSU DK005 TaxID=3383126 RepID=UPI003D7E59DE
MQDTDPVPQREESSTVARLQESIDAVLLPRGFAPGSAGASDRHRQIIWCAAADDFAARFPALPVSQEPPQGWASMCTDVVVDLVDVAVDDDDVASAGGDWRLSGVNVEGHPLDRLFAGLGLSATAERAGALMGSSAHECLTRLPPLLLELLEGATSQR